MERDKKYLEGLRANYQGQLSALLGDVATLKKTIAKLDEEIKGPVSLAQSSDKPDLTKPALKKVPNGEK